jgi:RimJ/RimL family protein N-acetyltransferase
MARHLTLLAIDRACAALVAVSPQAYAEQHDLRVEEVADSMSAVIGMTPPAMLDAGAWGTFFVCDSETRAVVGACGFKAPPDALGSVEIAYFTFPPREGHGLATAMASELTTRAKSSSAVERVIAHTRPERNASTRVLEKSGFQRDGEIVDPEDGLVWRWVRSGS